MKASFCSAILAILDDVVLFRNEIIAGSISILSNAQMLWITSASAKSRGVIPSAVLIIIWHLVMFKKKKKQSKYKQEEHQHSFQPSWQLSRCWFSFAYGFSVSEESTTPASTTTDMMFCKTAWLHENNKKANFSFTLFSSPHSSPLNGQVKFCQGKYIIWHTFPNWWLEESLL